MSAIGWGIFLTLLLVLRPLLPFLLIGYALVRGIELVWGREGKGTVTGRRRRSRPRVRRRPDGRNRANSQGSVPTSSIAVPTSFSRAYS